MSGTTEDRTARLVLLSADGPEQLARYRAELCTWLDEHPSASLDAVAHTLRVGREPLRERVALVVGSVAELAARLRDGERLVTGTATAGAAAASGGGAGPVATDDPAEAARLWVTGQDVVLPEPSGDRPARLSLPLPPLQTRRYWIKPPAGLADGPGERLLTGEEFYLRDHALGRIRILPAVAALEFAVAAAEQAGHGRATGIVNVLWARPVLVEDEPARVRLHLAPTADGVSYEVRLTDGSAEGALCSAGTLRFGAGPEAPRLVLDAIRARLPRTATAEECYEVFGALGGGYGPSLQGLRSVRSAPGEVLAYVAVPAAADLPSPTSPSTPPSWTRCSRPACGPMRTPRPRAPGNCPSPWTRSRSSGRCPNRATCTPCGPRPATTSPSPTTRAGSACGCAPSSPGPSTAPPAWTAPSAPTCSYSAGRTPPRRPPAGPYAP